MNHTNIHMKNIRERKIKFNTKKLLSILILSLLILQGLFMPNKVEAKTYNDSNYNTAPFGIKFNIASNDVNVGERKQINTSLKQGDVLTLEINAIDSIVASKFIMSFDTSVFKVTSMTKANTKWVTPYTDTNGNVVFEEDTGRYPITDGKIGEIKLEVLENTHMTAIKFKNIYYMSGDLDSAVLSNVQTIVEFKDTTVDGPEYTEGLNLVLKSGKFEIGQTLEFELVAYLIESGDITANLNYDDTVFENIDDDSVEWLGVWEAMSVSDPEIWGTVVLDDAPTGLGTGRIAKIKLKVLNNTDTQVFLEDLTDTNPDNSSITGTDPVEVKQAEAAPTKLYLSTNGAKWDGTLPTSSVLLKQDKNGTTYTIDKTKLTDIPKGYKVNFNSNGSGSSVTPSYIQQTQSFDKWNVQSGNGTISGDTFTFGTTDTTVKAIFKGDDITTFPTPTRPGYTFDGWYTTATGGSKVTSVTTTLTSDLTLYAHWTGKTYTVSYDLNGVTGTAPASKTFTYGSTSVTIASLSITNPGYTFGGWNTKTDKTGTTYAAGSTYNAASNVTLYAIWNPDTSTPYTVKHYQMDINGNYPSSPTSSVPYTGTTGTTVPAPVNTYTGFTSPAQQNITITADGNASVSYNYSRNQYAFNVSADSNGTVSGTTSGNKYYDSTISVTATANTGYTLDGWYNGATKVSSSNPYTFTMPDSAVTLVAKFKINTYTISYSLDGGAVTTANPTTYTINTPTITLNNPTKDGFIFAGWTGSNGSTKQTSVQIAQGSTGNKTYTANFTPITYTIKYDANGGTGAPSSQTKTYDTPLTLSTTEPTRTGYTFKGWDRNKNATTAEIPKGTTALSTNYTKVNNDTVTLYAVWSANTNTKYKVEHYKMDMNGNYPSTPDDTDPLTGTTDSSVTPAVKASYIGFTQPATQTVTINGDGSTVVKYYYTRNQYTIKFYNEDGSSKLDEKTVYYQTVIGSVYTGATQTKTNTAEYTYTPAGWMDAANSTGNNVTSSQLTSNISVYAGFTKVKNTYTVTYNNNDNATIKTATLEYGKSITSGYTGTAPTYSNPLPGHTYTFKEWVYADGPSAGTAVGSDTVTGIVTVKASYNDVVAKFTVTFKDDDGNILKTQKNVEYGTAATAPSVDASLKNTAQYSYTFDGWDKTFSNVTSDLTVIAQYTRTLRQYTIDFYNEDGTQLLDSQTKDFGTVIGSSYAGPAQSKSDTPKYSYTFEGWRDEKNSTGNRKDAATLDKDITVYASFASTLKSYIITFINDDKTSVLQSALVGYDIKIMDGYTEPTPIKTNQLSGHIYTFDGWEYNDGTLVGNDTVTGAVTVYAHYTDVLKKFTVIFKDDDGTELKKQENVPYGTAATAPTVDASRKNTAEFTYTFTGWSEDISNVTSDLLNVRAQYRQDVNQYTINFYEEDGTTLLKPQTVNYGTKIKDAYADPDPTKTATAEYTYTFIGWKEAPNTAGRTVSDDLVVANIDVYAGYTKTKNKYTVNYYNDDTPSTFITTAQVEYGELITSGYTMADPVKPNPIPGKTYNFDQWLYQDGTAVNTDVVRNDINVYASYTDATKKYTVTFRNDDGTFLWADNDVEDGTAATAPISNPTKADTVQYTYVFSGWDQDFSNVTSNMTVYAQYTRTLKQYTINFYNEDGTSLLDTQTKDFGTAIEDAYSKTTPVKTPTAEFTYNFYGWMDTTGSTGMMINRKILQADIDVYAGFRGTKNKYDVTYVNDDASVITTAQVEYGNQIISGFTGTPVVASPLPGHTYTFKEWQYNDGTPVGTDTVTQAVTVYANYTDVADKFTVEFKDDNGTVIDTVKDVPYGTAATAPANPTKPDTAQYTYTFSGWDKDFSNVISNMTVTAQYTQTLRQYVINFYSEDGTTLIEPQTKDYGTIIGSAFTQPQPSKAATVDHTYTFIGWMDSINSQGNDVSGNQLVDNIDVYAAFKEEVPKYTVTYLNDDASSITSAQLEYGSQIVSGYTGGNPLKVNQIPGHKYKFDQWLYSDGTPVGTDTVTGDVTVYASYSDEIQKFVVLFKDADGTVLKTQTEVPYGTAATAPADPTKPDTAQYTYRFIGWNKDFSNVDRNLVVTAQYEELVKQFTINFYNEDGSSIIDTKVVDYGTTVSSAFAGTAPTKDSTAQYKFTFDGWMDDTDSNGNKVDSVSITSDMDVYAGFTKEINKYVVRFLNDDQTTILDSCIVEYMESASYSGKEPEATIIRPGYTSVFAGWEGNMNNITDHTDIIAKYEYIKTVYTIEYRNTKGMDNSMNPTSYTIDDGILQLFDLEDRENRIFDGWYITENNQDVKITSIDTSKLENLVLYARWNSDSLYLESEKYKIGVNDIDIYEQNDVYLDKIEPNTTLKEFRDNCDSNGTIYVYDLNGNMISKDDYVGTGMTIKVVGYGEQFVIKAIVMDDLDGDGEVTAIDLSQVNQVCLRVADLTTIQFKATDLDENNAITALDLSTINQVELKTAKLTYLKPNKK